MQRPRVKIFLMDFENLLSSIWGMALIAFDTIMACSAKLSQKGVGLVISYPRAEAHGYK